MSPTAFHDQPDEHRKVSYYPAPPRRNKLPFQFSLATLLFVTTFVAVGAGLTAADVTLGASFLVVGGLALVRTFIECGRILQDGRLMLMSDKLGALVVSFGYTFLALVSAIVVYSVLGMLALGVASAAQWVAEMLAGPTAGLAAAAVVGFVLIACAVFVAARTFYSLYWKTISPRTTVDPLSTDLADNKMGR
jgi:hypothetical protein